MCNTPLAQSLPLPPKVSTKSPFREFLFIMMNGAKRSAETVGVSKCIGRGAFRRQKEAPA